MSLMLYVNEEINESRGLEYLRRNCLNAQVFSVHVLYYTGRGYVLARKRHPRGELDMSCSFELLRTVPDNRRIVRVRLVTRPPSVKHFRREHFTSFLVLLDQAGSVIEAFNDSSGN
jgi:hypothetical protein